MENQTEQASEEIWDDSALMDTWNEAFEEYKYYHSLHARGEKVEDVLRRFEEDGTIDGEPADAHMAEVKAEDSDTELQTHTRGGATRDTQNIHGNGGQTSSTSLRNATGENNGTMGAGAPAPNRSVIRPERLVPSVQDENLKNLMMSWYYSGYYTGYHEGQRDLQEELQAGKETR